MTRENVPSGPSHVEGALSRGTLVASCIDWDPRQEVAIGTSSVQTSWLLGGFVLGSLRAFVILTLIMCQSRSVPLQ